MSTPIEIVPLSFARTDVLRFLTVAYEVYRGDPLWVAPLLSDSLCLLSPKNPFFAHATMHLWIARRNGRDVGRIAAIVDPRDPTAAAEGSASFGFFESIPDATVADRLFTTLLAWARNNRVRRLVGPMNPSINDECGLLIQGFDSPPTLLMTYNPPGYAAFVEAAGFTKAKDLYAYHIDPARCPRERLERVVHRYRQRHPELVVRPVLKRRLAADLPLVKRIYNEAWDHNWGAVALDDAEIDFMAGRLKPLLTDGLAWLAEWAGEPAGLLVALLDFNQALRPLRGRLLGPGLLRALPYLVGTRRPNACRVFLLGVRHRFRRRGLEAILLHETLAAAHRLQLTAAEASWILEDNHAVQQTIAHQGGRLAKVYRLYERAVD